MGDWFKSLRAPMQVNAVCSLLAGAALLVATRWVDARLQLGATTWLHALGVALLGHAALLAWASGRSNAPRRWAVANLVTIAPYPLLLLVLGATAVTKSVGRTLLLIDGTVIGGLALWHALVLHRNRGAWVAA